MTDAVQKAKKHRSPAYPGINLQQAIKRTVEFYEQEHRNPASFKAAVKHWDYSEKSSGALVTAAALKSFGLMADVESGSGRTLQVTPLGLRIVADKRPESQERDIAIREAALLPKIHQEIWRKWNGRLPSDAELQYRLENDWHFNVNAIDPFIKELRETIAFAKLSESDKLPEMEVERDDKSDEGEEKTPYVPKVGDYVQWEHSGMLGFPEPQRIREVSADGAFVFIEGSYTGIPANEMILQPAPLVKPPETPVRIQPPSKTYMQEFVVPLSDGLRAVFQWPAMLTQEDVMDLMDSLKILARKIERSSTSPAEITPEEAFRAI